MRKHRQRRHAFTLIETVLAVALAAAIVTAATTAAVQSLDIQKTAESETRRLWERTDLMDQFEQDVSSELRWLNDNIDTLRIPDAHGSLIEILGLADVDPGTAPARRRMPARIFYRVEPSPARDGTHRLVREVHDLTRPEAGPTRDILANGLEYARLRYWIESGWQAATPGSFPEDGDPPAVRLECAWRSSKWQPVSHTVLRLGRTPHENASTN